MLDDALAAVSHMFTAPFRKVLFKTLGLTIALLALIWFGLEKLLIAVLHHPYPWLMAHPWLISALTWVSGVGLFVGLLFLITPASFLVAGSFFDELAEVVERDIAPNDPPGRTLPLGEAAGLGLEFAALSLGVNIVALLLLLVPGINAIAFFGANAYLFGRGYFELAALRRVSHAQARRLRKANELRLFAGGLLMAAMLAVPGLNLLTPLFGTALFVRVSWDLMRRDRPMAQTSWLASRERF